jgi:hypothetical protein
MQWWRMRGGMSGWGRLTLYESRVWIAEFEFEAQATSIRPEGQNEKQILRLTPQPELHLGRRSLRMTLQQDVLKAVA